MAAFPAPTRVLVFSDDPAWCREHLDGPRVTVVDLEDTMLTFAAMQHCDHFIIGNSTFSWWAAWLGERAGTRVLTPPPERWYGPKQEPRDMSDVIPPRWTHVPCDEEPQR